MYRKLTKDGAIFISVPSAFTKNTGERHWHILLKARAIENMCYIFAPAQTGIHPNQRETYGHSLIISPDGEVLAEKKMAKEYFWLMSIQTLLQDLELKYQV